MQITTLVLWDIDHTLIETGSVGNAAFRAAFKAATGVTMKEMADPSGLTEPEVFQRTLALHDINSTDSLFDVFKRVQADFYAGHAGEMRDRGRVLPGVEQALAKISARSDMLESVLTGNTRDAAQTKLRAFGVDRHIDFDIGAYGTDDAVRARLVDIARERAARHAGHRFDARATVLIGDTPLDVEAGHERGARVIAVATGRTDVTKLQEAGADTVLVDVTNTEQLLAAITSA